VPGAGVDLLCKVGDAVQAGAPLYRIHAQYPADLGFARDRSGRDSGYTVGAA
jgi:thymidine phosphorylase